ATGVLDFHFARHQKRKNLEVRGRLVASNLLDRLLALMAEVQQQRLHEFLVQQMTRAVPVAVGGACTPWLERHGASTCRQNCAQHEQISDPFLEYECK